MNQELEQFRRDFLVSASTLVHLVSQREMEKRLVRCDGVPCGSHLVLEKLLFVQHFSESTTFWLAEFFGTLHFPTIYDVTLSLWLAELLELVSFVAYKQAELFTK